MKRILSVIGLVLVIVLLWGLLEPRMLLDTQEVEASLPHLPESWEGSRVALLADFQVGMWLDNTDMIRGAVRRAVETKPRLLLIAGDFVYKADSSVVREAVNLIRPAVESGMPVLAVLGNHDYSLAVPEDEAREELAAYLEGQLEAAGVTVLENESVEVDGLTIVGIGSDWAGKSRPAGALAGMPADRPRIVFMHNPIVFRDLPAGSAPLALAAHTHGGQLRIPMTRSTSWLDIARSREVVADGWSAENIGKPGNRAYVNRGIGFSLVPIRILCRPELTLFTLRSD